jgi:hypothetical protein
LFKSNLKVHEKRAMFDLPDKGGIKILKIPPRWLRSKKRLLPAKYRKNTVQNTGFFLLTRGHRFDDLCGTRKEKY